MFKAKSMLKLFSLIKNCFKEGARREAKGANGHQGGPKKCFALTRANLWAPPSSIEISSDPRLDLIFVDQIN